MKPVITPSTIDFILSRYNTDLTDLVNDETLPLHGPAVWLCRMVNHMAAIQQEAQRSRAEIMRVLSSDAVPAAMAISQLAVQIESAETRVKLCLEMIDIAASSFTPRTVQLVSDTAEMVGIYLTDQPDSTPLTPPLHGHTRHNHPCCGEAKVGGKKGLVARCGGTRMCKKCGSDAQLLHSGVQPAS